MAQELGAMKKHVNHLSSLLNESEANVNRLSEQTKVQLSRDVMATTKPFCQLLKNELRRQETNEKRAETELNLEYLKNVVLKFLSFSDEREHLVPVLGMLLQVTSFSSPLSDSVRS